MVEQNPTPKVKAPVNICADCKSAKHCTYKIEGITSCSLKHRVQQFGGK